MEIQNTVSNEGISTGNTGGQGKYTKEDFQHEAQKLAELPLK